MCSYPLWLDNCTVEVRQRTLVTWQLSVNKLSCLCTKFFWFLARSKYLLWWGSFIWVKGVATCIKCFYVSSKGQMFTLVVLSWFGIKAFVSCVVYFGLLLDVILCSGILLVVLGTRKWYVQKLIVFENLLPLFGASALYLPCHRWGLHSTDLYSLVFSPWDHSQFIFFWYRIKPF